MMGVTKLYVPSLHCESCEKRISRVLGKEHGVDSMSFEDDAINIVYDNDSITKSSIIDKIESLGYRVSDVPIDGLKFSERYKHYKENPNEYSIEKTSLYYALIMTVALWIVPILTYMAFFRDTQNFWSSYIWWFFYLNISIAFIGATIRVILSYNAKITGMTGMMIGMTIGMQTGMMIGAVLGATNGFFVGAMAGMILGVLVGAILGNCCGVMGVMEGMMAGLMGGTMGPMISVMMIADNILLFMPLYIIINIIILLGLWYMHYESAVYKAPRVVRKPIDFMTYASVSIVVCAVITFIMLYAPRNIMAIFVS